MQVPFRIAFKVGAAAAAAGIVAAGMAFLLGSREAFWGALLAALFTALASGVAVALLTARKLEAVRSALDALRKETPRPAARPSRFGDELDEVRDLVDRTRAEVERRRGVYKDAETHQRDLLGNVSHEMKTPIFAIQGFAETLAGGAMEDPRVAEAFLQKIMRNAARLEALVRDLSDIARLDSGALRLRSAPFALRGVVRDAVETVEPVAAAHAVKVEHAIPADLPEITGDADRLRQVIVNLLDNGIKYNRPGGRVLVSAEKSGDGGIRVAVSDTGIGVHPDDVPRLTERFFRVDRSRSRAQGGSGLGLAIAKHLLQAHGADLVIESTAGEGSTFSFTLRAQA